MANSNSISAADDEMLLHTHGRPRYRPTNAHAHAHVHVTYMCAGMYVWMHALKNGWMRACMHIRCIWIDLLRRWVDGWMDRKVGR